MHGPASRGDRCCGEAGRTRRPSPRWWCASSAPRRCRAACRRPPRCPPRGPAPAGAGTAPSPGCAAPPPPPPPAPPGRAEQSRVPGWRAQAEENHLQSSSLTGILSCRWNAFILVSFAYLRCSVHLQLQLVGWRSVRCGACSLCFGASWPLGNWPSEMSLLSPLSRCCRRAAVANSSGKQLPDTERALSVQGWKASTARGGGGHAPS